MESELALYYVLRSLLTLEETHTLSSNSITIHEYVIIVIQVFPGSVIVELTLEDSNFTLTGANVSVLVEQIQSDVSN